MPKNADPNERISLNLPLVLEGYKTREAAERAAQSWADEVFTAEVKEAVSPRGQMGTADAGRGRRVSIFRAVKTTFSVIIDLRKRAEAAKRARRERGNV